MLDREDEATVPPDPVPLDPAALPEQDWDRLAELFESVAGLPPGERAAYLDAECSDRPALRREVEEMLRSSGDESALEIEDHLLRWDESALPPGYRIGPYKLVRPMARGGMGEVYLGERTDGSYSQQVAVKLLRPGLEATGMLDRFRIERDVLARLSHPSVVPLLDGGATPEGRPYLVLQYVDGLPITEFCTERRLGRRARLRLFIKLCRAVQYAHSHLIVHRDLKPSNVLVDNSGGVRLLDFGIAKLLARHPADGATRAAERAPMTPERAAPEQLAGEPVTTSTDVWALGLLLCELLTGRLPNHASGGSGSGPTLPAAAEPLDRDLAAIAGRAVRERPDERYATAGELADDVERWLDGKPVRARPDSLRYRARRFVGRHRAAVASAAAAVLALAALAVVSTVQSARAVRAGEHAAAEERKAKAVVDLLLETFGATDPHAGAIGDSVSIGALLDQGEERAVDLDAQPEVQAALRHALGRIRLERGNYERARELLGAARDAEIARLGEADPATVPVRMNYARSLHASRRQDEAERELRASLAVLEASPGGDPEVEAAVLMVLASVVHGEEGVRALERAVALMRERRDRDPVGYADVLTGLALMRRMTGDDGDARALYHEAMPLYVAALGAEAPRTLVIRSNLASLLDDPAARVAEHREVLELRRRRLGDESGAVATSWNHLGLALADHGHLGEAADAFRRSEEIWTRLGGPEHPMAIRTLHNRALTLVRQERLEEADRAYAQLEERLDQAHGSNAFAATVRTERAEIRARLAGEESDGGPAPAAASAHG